MLFLKKSLNARDLSLTVDSEGRFVICDCSLSNVEYRIIYLYAPNDLNSRKLFFDRIYAYLDCRRKIIMLGDFNCVCDVRDRSCKTRQRDISTGILNEIVTEFTLYDVANYQRKDQALRYTHFQGTSHARLDRAYVSIELLTGFKDYSVSPVYFSDHALVSFFVGGKQKNAGFQWGLWKLNNSLLKDDVFNESIEALLVRMPDGRESPSARWEWFKREFKLTAIERASTLAYWKKAEEKLLLDDLHRISKLECEHPGQFTD